MIIVILVALVLLILYIIFFTNLLTDKPTEPLYFKSTDKPIKITLPAGYEIDMERLNAEVRAVHNKYSKAAEEACGLKPLSAEPTFLYSNNQTIVRYQPKECVYMDERGDIFTVIGQIAEPHPFIYIGDV